MRILLFLHSFGPGGVERVAMRLAEAWADAGHEVRLLIGRNEGPERALAPHNVLYDFAPRSPLARPFETLWMVRQLIGAVRRHRPDVLFCPGNTYTIVACLARAVLGSECPPIVCKLSNSLDRRDLPGPARFVYRIWLRQHRHFIERFVGLSEPMKAEIERYLGASPDRVASIPNPVLTMAEIDALSINRPMGQEGSRRYISVGRLTRQKNLSLLLRAFARVAGPNDRLLIVGDGPQRKRLARLAEKLGMTQLVEFTGHQASVTDLLKSADVFVSSSNYEGMPAAVVEALAAGLRIVATQSSTCLSHLLQYGDLGRLVPIRDVDALAEALQSSIGGERPSRSTRRAAAARYTVELSAERYLQVLASAAADRGGVDDWTSLQPLAEAA